MAEHVNQRHGIHLFGDSLVAFDVRGGKVDVQIAKQMGRHPQGHACHACSMCINVVRLFGRI
jgi:hypothetical protein